MRSEAVSRFHGGNMGIESRAFRSWKGTGYCVQEREVEVLRHGYL